MKNKILTSVMLVVLLAILLLSTSFVILINMREIDRTKEMLKNINYLVCQTEKMENAQVSRKLNEYTINDSKVRVTLVDKTGNIIYDNITDSRENHNNREEIKEAFDSGSGYRIRYSETLKAKLMYYAVKIDNNTVVRTAVPIKTIKMMDKENFEYYICIVIAVIVFSLFFSLRLVRILVEPIKQLESVTLKMAGGDYKIRANINTNDELGTLSSSFNHMAVQLQKKIEEVVEKQQKLEYILRSMESGVIAVDENNTVISINPYVEMLLGIKKDIKGENLFDYVNDYHISEFIKQDEKNEGEIKILHPIERELKVKKSNIVSDVGKIGKVLIFQDITDSKRIELMRTQFVANVTHELKTPLTSIKGFAETLKIVEDEETREKFLDIINKEAERLTRLINDILVLSNIESNLVSEIDEFSPGVVLEDVINIMKKIALNKNVKIEYSDENSENILGNKDKFHQLALNLIENGVKYSKETGGKVTIHSYNEDQYYCLDISDDGIGIPKEDMPRIFERFYRVDKSRKKGGTGLGLAIVKHIVKIFNGTIEVESELGTGTVFKIKIPYI